MDKKRRIFSTFLLAVYLTALLCAVSHRHEALLIPEQEECAECVHHLPHTGHISTYSGGMASCVFCHFLGLPYVFLPFAVMLLPEHVLGTLFSPQRNAFIAACSSHTQSRAPPVSKWSLSF